MTNKFAPTYRSQESSNYFFGSYNFISVSKKQVLACNKVIVPVRI